MERASCSAEALARRLPRRACDLPVGPPAHLRTRRCGGDDSRLGRLRLHVSARALCWAALARVPRGYGASMSPLNLTVAALSTATRSNGRAATPSESPAYTFAPALPAGHFVSEFIRYAAECSDTAHEYYEAVAFILLAVATPQVRARLRQYPGGLPTAFYAILIGDSTRSR